jgi:son of sevenless-like protein
VEPGQSPEARDRNLDYLDALCSSQKANLNVVNQTFEALLTVGHDQADMAQGDYNGSIDWRMSRLSVIDTQFGGAVRPMSTLLAYDSDPQGDMLDLGMALGRKGHVPAESFDSMRYQSNGNGIMNDEPEPSLDETMVSPDSPGSRADYADASPNMDEDCEHLIFPLSCLSPKPSQLRRKRPVRQVAASWQRSLAQITQKACPLPSQNDHLSLGICFQHTARPKF